MIETKFLTHKNKCLLRMKDPIRAQSADLWMDARQLALFVSSASLALDKLQHWEAEEHQINEYPVVELKAL